jgi:hypothetical protein
MWAHRLASKARSRMSCHSVSRDRLAERHKDVFDERNSLGTAVLVAAMSVAPGIVPSMSRLVAPRIGPGTGAVAQRCRDSACSLPD